MGDVFVSSPSSTVVANEPEVDTAVLTVTSAIVAENDNISSLVSEVTQSSVVQIGQMGPQGASVTGPQGPAGPQGNTVIFEQMQPLGIWIVAHGLQKYPSVTVVDSSGALVEGAVTYTDDNNILITFSAPFSGKAFLN